MKNNEILQKDVQDAIKWEPLLNAAEIGVTAKDGIITLSGTVDCYAKKTEAEDAAKKVAGVKAVVEKIEVIFSRDNKRDDNDIASEIVHAFNWNLSVPNNKVKVRVEDGWVTLEGEVQWNYQKEAAKKSVSNQAGVRCITNNITINTDIEDELDKEDIQAALARNWSIEAKQIQVEVSGHKVTLTGSVPSWYDKEEATRTSWNAPGVHAVENDLLIID